MSITKIGSSRAEAKPEISPTSYGGKFLISSATIPNGTSRISVSDIPGTYDDLLIEIHNLFSTQNASMSMTINNTSSPGTYFYKVNDLDQSPANNTYNISSADSTSFGTESLANGALAAISESYLTLESYISYVTVLIRGYASDSSYKFIEGKSSSLAAVRFIDGGCCITNPVKFVRFNMVNSTTTTAASYTIAKPGFALLPKISVYGIKNGI